MSNTLNIPELATWYFTYYEEQQFYNKNKEALCSNIYNIFNQICDKMSDKFQVCVKKIGFSNNGLPWTWWHVDHDPKCDAFVTPSLNSFPINTLKSLSLSPANVLNTLMSAYQITKLTFI